METVIEFVINLVKQAGNAVIGICNAEFLFVFSILYYAFWLFAFLFFDLAGKVARFKRALIRGNKFLSSNVVNDANIAEFNKLITRFPDSVRLGWGYYKQNKIGYPSEFITEYDCLRVPMVGNKKKTFLTVYLMLASIFELVTLGVLAWRGGFLIAEVMAFSLLLAILVYGVLTLVLNHGESKIFRLFRKFQMLLDEKVELYEAKGPLSSALEEKGVLMVAAEREQIAKAEELAKFIKKVETACADSETTKEDLIEMKKRLIAYAVDTNEEKASAIIIGAIKSVDGAIATRE